MIVRPAAADDVDAIAQLHVAAWQAAYRGVVPDAFLDALTVEKRRELWERRLAQSRSSTLLVAEDVGVPVGFCLFGPARGADGAGPPVGEIIALNVRPDRWRRGIGRALCESVLVEAPGREWRALTLWVLKGNRRAALFYEALGFSADGTERDDPYVPGVSELRYRRPV